MQAVEVAVELAVGRPDQRELAPRDDEDHAVVAGRVVDGALGQLRQQAVNALGPPQDAGPALRHAGELAELVHPRAGRVDDDPRAERRDAPGQEVARANAGDPALRVADDLGDLGVVEGPRAQPARRENVLEAEPLGIDEQIVEVVAGAAEVARPERRLERERVDRGQYAIALPVPARRQPVVELQSDAHLDEAARRLPVDRHQERQRPHEVGRQPAQRLALAERFAHQREVEQLEIAQAAVDQLRRLGRRGRREVALLDQRRRHAAQGEIARDPGAGHAAADDDHVVLGILERPGTIVHRITHSLEGPGRCARWPPLTRAERVEHDARGEAQADRQPVLVHLEFRRVMRARRSVAGAIPTWK